MRFYEKKGKIKRYVKNKIFSVLVKMMQRIFSRYQWSSIDKTTYSVSNKVLRYSIG